MFTSAILASIVSLGLVSAAPTPAPASESKNLVARAQFSGTATYYFQGGAAGSCGDYHSGTFTFFFFLRLFFPFTIGECGSVEADHVSDSDFIVAVNAPQQPGSCGKQVTITNTKNGKTATALAADTCKS